MKMELTVSRSDLTTKENGILKREVDKREPSDAEELQLRKDLRQRFSNPFFGCRNRCKPAFVVLPMKFIFITVALIIFGNDRSNFAKYLDRNNLALKRLLLQDWTTLYETMPYPPATGQYALYSIEELVSHINHTVHKVVSLKGTSVGSIFDSGNEEAPLSVCVDYFEKGVYDRNTKDVIFDETTRTNCKDININSADNFSLDPSIPDLMLSNDGSLVRLIRVSIEFFVDSVYMDMEKSPVSPRCFCIKGKVTFDNSDMNGQIPVSLQSEVSEFKCTLNGQPTNIVLAENNVYAICSIALIFTSISLVLSIHMFVKSVILLRRTKSIFWETQQVVLPLKEQLWILQIREMVTVIGDIVTFSGLVLNLTLNSKVLSSSSSLYDCCGVLLSIGFIIICSGGLHFLSFSKGFNVLFDVIEKSILPVLRFIACAAVLYVAFALCGWIVMGPYHIKFASIYDTFRCLFGLISGDEVYVTLAAVPDAFSFAWWFCAVFVTSYIVIFTLVALNVLIAIFNATYEAVKNQSRTEYRKTYIDTFLAKKIET